jgi:hypothetical protein
LARGVVRHVAAAVRVDDDGVELGGRNQEVLLLGSNPARVRRRMFEQQDVVIARLHERALQIVGLGEGDPSQMTSAKHLALALQVHPRE